MSKRIQLICPLCNGEFWAESEKDFYCANGCHYAISKQTVRAYRYKIFTFASVVKEENKLEEMKK